MVNIGLRDLILQVISSWQVIAATVVILIYIFLVNYVARTKRITRLQNRLKMKKPKKEKNVAAPPEETADDSELGLEE